DSSTTTTSLAATRSPTATLTFVTVPSIGASTCPLTAVPCAWSARNGATSKRKTPNAPATTTNSGLRETRTVQLTRPTPISNRPSPRGLALTSTVSSSTDIRIPPSLSFLGPNAIRRSCPSQVSNTAGVWVGKSIPSPSRQPERLPVQLQTPGKAASCSSISNRAAAANNSLDGAELRYFLENSWSMN